jgi:hypothetical protein
MKSQLIELLQRRETIIADHSWRDREAAGHLQALKDVSGEISTWTEAHGAACDARLRHYLTNASFAKALAHLLAGSDS